MLDRINSRRRGVRPQEFEQFIERGYKLAEKMTNGIMCAAARNAPRTLRLRPLLPDKDRIWQPLNRAKMLIPFAPIKIAQAAAVLLKAEPTKRMGRLRLLKLLYIADREALKERARPITGDKPVAMDHGPVLSHTNDLIKGMDFASPEWSKYLRTEGRDVELIEDPGVGKLTRYEIMKLQEVAERFSACDDWTVAEMTHEFPEWAKNRPDKGSCRPIPLDDLLEATGHAQDKESLLATERAESAFKRLIASVEK